jgi:hypothetical protein
VRAWARQTGRSVSKRGRVPASLVAEYNAAHSGGDAAAPAAPASPRKKATGARRGRPRKAAAVAG